MKRLWFPDPRYCLVAATAFVSIFCLIPLSLYAHSGEDWNFRWYLLLIPAGIGLARISQNWRCIGALGSAITLL
jgi:hypothetical protein